MKNLAAFLLSFGLCLSLAQAAAAFPLDTLKGHDVLTGQSVKIQTGERKGVVLVFLSSTCPCSNSHMQELASLEKEYPDFAFIGIHSNTDEKKDATQAYFREAKLPFPVLQDNGAKIADELKAYKTPHAFVMKPNGEILYQGGVSNSHALDRASRKYLREALEDASQGRPVRTPEGRTLGCVIARGGSNAW